MCLSRWLCERRGCLHAKMLLFDSEVLDAFVFVREIKVVINGMDIEKLESALKQSFSAETCQGRNVWQKDNPAYGHCALVVLIVQDYFGGEIVFASAKLPNNKEVKHYFNKINNEIIDLTRSQFPSDTIITPKIIPKDFYGDIRKTLLSYSETLRKYNILREKIEKIIGRPGK